MAIPKWLNINPTSGVGDAVIINTAEEHTGRVERSAVVTIKEVNSELTTSYSVTQEAAAEFVKWNKDETTEGDNVVVAKEATKLTLQGFSNSAALTFGWKDGEGITNDLDNPAKYGIKVGESTIEVNNGANIEGDPGAECQYEWNLEIDVPENTLPEEVLRVLRVATSGGTQILINVHQSAAEAYLRTTPQTVVLNATGGSVNVNVESNTSWAIS